VHGAPVSRRQAVLGASGQGAMRAGHRRSGRDGVNDLESSRIGGL
jgi:hypothetical protein